MIVRAEWPGYVVDVLVNVGQEVDEDENLVLMEGTDSAHTPFYVTAPDAGKVRKVFVEEGDFADEDDDVIEMGDVE